MAEKLIIDMGMCRPQEQSNVLCSYNNHPDNLGFDSLLEMIRFALICRRCKEAPCIMACPRKALEKVQKNPEDEGVLKRSNMLCTGCGTCSIACPFGTVLNDLILFPSSVCDLCKGRLSSGEKPLCVRTGGGAIEYADVKPSKQNNMIEVFEDIVVRVKGGQLWEPFLGDKTVAKSLHKGIKR
jgi:Fe-S-cluster-containing dehydrogenase component